MTTLEEKLRARIKAAGQITFAEFMEVALYDPDSGYYTSPDRISARGDFYTSPEVHPAFGALICVQLREMWWRLDRPAPFTCIEMGAGRGRLMRDITGYAPLMDPDFADALHYVTVDRAAPGQQRATHETATSGVVLSNELLDAFPVHRFVIEAGRVRELYVCVERNGELGLARGDPSSEVITRRFDGLPNQLPDGFVGEVCTDLAGWANSVALSLTRGYVLTIDFGHDRADLYAPPRSSGTLRCYWRHQEAGDPFDRIGAQDIAAHVDFTAVDEALSAAGFARVGRTSQSEFLTRLGARDLVRRVYESKGSRSERERHRSGILELIRPTGLGGFRVVAHGRGVDPEQTLAGFSGSRDHTARPVPFPEYGPDGQRIPVGEGRYPHAATEMTATWEDLLEPPNRE
ncbi:MAG: SAM-dependent methyltransferase [SAR202 cluster bacterium]|nr:SAM-dependent methyltransferase [SAR202 cluster bacterium]